MIVVADERVRAHVAVALRAHLRGLRRDGVQPPDELVRLSDELARGVLSGQDVSNLAVPLPSADDETALVTSPAAARRLGISPSTLRRRVVAGEVLVVRIGRSVRFRPDDLDEYAKRCTR